MEAQTLLTIKPGLSIPIDEIGMEAMRAQGAGGQNVNKVASAIHLRFDVKASSLSEFQKQRLLERQDSRLTKDGVLIIKAQRYRTQDKNREDALDRLAEWIRLGLEQQKKRVATKPSLASKRRRLQTKQRRSDVKRMRSKVKPDE